MTRNAIESSRCSAPRTGKKSATRSSTRLLGRLLGLTLGLMVASASHAQTQARTQTQTQTQGGDAMPVATNINAATPGAATPNAANAERLIEMMELEQTTTAALAEMVTGLNRQVQQLSAALKARGVDPDPTTKEIDALIKRFQARVNWTQLKPVLSQIMQDSYTPEQLQAVVDFMSSPVMQGLPTKMAEANKKTEALIRAQTSQLSADIQRVVNKAVTQSGKASAMTGMQATP
jgi:hypothetical protein